MQGRGQAGHSSHGNLQEALRIHRFRQIQSILSVYIKIKLSSGLWLLRQVLIFQGLVSDVPARQFGEVSDTQLS